MSAFSVYSCHHVLFLCLFLPKCKDVEEKCMQIDNRNNRNGINQRHSVFECVLLNVQFSYAALHYFWTKCDKENKITLKLVFDVFDVFYLKFCRQFRQSSGFYWFFCVLQTNALVFSFLQHVCFKKDFLTWFYESLQRQLFYYCWIFFCFVLSAAQLSVCVTLLVLVVFIYIF